MSENYNFRENGADNFAPEINSTIKVEMEIVLTKLNPSQHKLLVLKSGTVCEETILDTKTFFLHDVVHYCVETELKLKDGFWAMIGQGYPVARLMGKDNKLTEELRRTEQLVGYTQALYSGHLTTEMFWSMLRIIDFILEQQGFAEIIVERIDAIMDRWRHLPVGQAIKLDFTI